MEKIVQSNTIKVTQPIGEQKEFNEDDYFDCLGKYMHEGPHSEAADRDWCVKQITVAYLTGKKELTFNLLYITEYPPNYPGLVLKVRPVPYVLLCDVDGNQMSKIPLRDYVDLHGKEQIASIVICDVDGNQTPKMTLDEYYSKQTEF